MHVVEIIIGIALLLMAVFLVVSILMQSGKDKRLSGTIAGGAETFFGKEKASTMDKVLSKVTTIVAIVFAVLVVVMYMIQGL
ncbi:MAG: preprotein translocase subunit SecG [Clostridia bacterium]|nr:preprotein translocase subunit SecG [Clostridia bacterium]